MNRRTRDENFSNCPLCGKKPYVKLKNEDYAICYCRGRLFCNHTLIHTDAWRGHKDGLYKNLMSKWNELEELKPFKETEQRKWLFL